MAHDPFSDLLQLTDPSSVVAGGFAAGGRWALSFPPPGKLKFFAVARGSCSLLVDGARPITLELGDVFLVSARTPFVLASNPGVTPRDARRVFTTEVTFATLGDGRTHLLIGGHVSLNAATGDVLAELLPPIIHVRSAAPQAAVLQWLLAQLLRERDAQLPGAHVASTHLAQLMFVQVLRAYLSGAEALPSGILRAVSDERIAPALRLLHAKPQRAWQVHELAKAAGMSRTAFAVYFKRVAGIAPLAYLTTWRMHLARRALRSEARSISELADRLGYASESAFSNAFKRVVGVAPRRYRHAEAERARM